MGWGMQWALSSVIINLDQVLIPPPYWLAMFPAYTQDVLVLGFKQRKVWDPRTSITCTDVVHAPRLFIHTTRKMIIGDTLSTLVHLEPLLDHLSITVLN
jgi:hypothetical protein